MGPMSRLAVTVPKLGLTAEEVTIERWAKGIGDRVTKGEALAEMTTDKALVELEAPTDGVVVEIVVDTNGTVPVGAVLAYLDGAGHE